MRILFYVHKIFYMLNLGNQSLNNYNNYIYILILYINITYYTILNIIYI